MAALLNNLTLLLLYVAVLAPQSSTTAFQQATSNNRHLVVVRSTATSSSSTATTVDEVKGITSSPTPTKSRTIKEDGTGLYQEDRYVTTVRYLVNPTNKKEQVDFEHSWTSKAQQLASTQGLTYFHMGKRAADFMGPPLPDTEFNYQSYAVWESKEAYEKVCDTLPMKKKVISTTTGAVEFDGTDKGGSPANYDGLFALTVPTSVSGMAGSMSPSSSDTTTIDVDTSKRIKREGLVASNRFGIKPGFEKEFEEMWASRDSSLRELPGFVNFQLLRREGTNENIQTDDGNTYVSYTTWDSLKAFNNWRESDNFKRSHRGKSSNEDEKPKESPYTKMPKVVTFKTFLVVSAKDGM